MAFQLAIERGNSYPIAVKGIFAISLTIFFYTNSIVHLITTDLTIVLFISGIFLSILSLLKPVEWIIRKYVTIFHDNDLSEGSIGFWKTLEEPQWEIFRNDVTGDVYLVFVFLIIFSKLILNPPFVDFSELESFSIPFLDSTNILFIGLLILTINTVLCAVVIRRVILRIRSNRINLILSQHFLSLQNSGGSIDQKIETYYSSKQWFLFRSFYRKYHQKISDFFIGKRSEFNQKSQGVDDSLRDISRILREVIGEIKKNRLNYHSKFSTHDYLADLMDFEPKVRILLIFYSLISGKIKNAGMMISRQALDVYSDQWIIQGPHDEEHLANALFNLPSRVEMELEMNFTTQIDFSWIEQFYYQLDNHILSLEDTIQKITEFINKDLIED